MKNMKMTMVGIMVFAFAGVTQADLVNSLMILDGISTNTADDASAEYISNGGTGINDYDATRTISVGDTIRGGFTISRINSTSSNVGINGVDEWSGAFSIKVVSITGSVDPAMQDHTIVFGADPNFGAWLNAIESGKGDSMPSGAAIRMWEDTTPDVDFLALSTDANAELADSFVATAMDGSFYWDLGFGTRGGTWIAANSALLAPADFEAAIAGSPANFELTLLGSSAIAVDLKESAMVGPITGRPVDVIGNTGIFGAGLTIDDSEENAGFHARNKATLQFKAVPEPASLALLGLGGLAMLRRRKA